ncbi:hypothetical protein [Streptomyces sp. NPDC101249]|uniref:hypothetical protein n=1 Tax=Streptomyces sp. NPDC101249 TaxID=3366140 RepID=UPI0037FA9EFF
MNTDRPDHDDETGPERRPEAGTDRTPAPGPESGRPDRAGTEPGTTRPAPEDTDSATGEGPAGTEPPGTGGGTPESDGPGTGASAPVENGTAAAEPPAPADLSDTADPAVEAAPSGADRGPAPGSSPASPAAGPGVSGAADGVAASGAVPEEPDAADVTPEEAAGADGGAADGRAGGGGLTTRPPRRWSPVLIASVAAAVLLVGGGGAYLASSVAGDDPVPAGSGGDAAPPPKLALDGYAGGGGGDSRGIAAGEPNPYGAHYRADGDLPTGPASAPVYRATGEVTEAEVARLAKALGLDGTPVARGQSWQVGSAKDGAGPDLTVDRAAPGIWSFHRYAAGSDACGSAARCATEPSDGAAEPVGQAAARKAAAPVLKAIGQDGAKLDAGQVTGAQRVVNADPVVGGLPTFGWTTGLTVGANGELVGGTGRLKAPVAGADYPVLGAAETLALMNEAPVTDHRMGVGGCASAVPLKDRLEQPCGSGTGTGTGTSGSAAGGTVTVGDAEFGLALRTRQGQPLLVPSWLFEVRGTDGRDGYTVAHPAVDPAYLTSPSAPSQEPTAGGSAGPRDVRVDGYRADGRELTVGFTGGVCADYTATAEESDGAVTVTVTEKPWKGKVCVMIAKEMRQKVTLDAPLGDRKVVGTGGAGVAPLKGDARTSGTR